MIGVVSKREDDPVVREFFELFKTEWEFYCPSHRYDAIICTVPSASSTLQAPLMLIFDAGACDGSVGERCGCVASHRGNKIPIYGKTQVLGSIADDLDLVDFHTHEPLSAREPIEGSTIIRLGYDLLAEVRILLTRGQPAEYADSPTLELHISMVRDLLTEFDVRFSEIPPRPKGFQFIACLTHDVDHPLLRVHRVNHTTFGFVFRAVFGSALNFLRGRTTAAQLFTNWMAVLKLPFVHLGLASDPWASFDRDYRAIEKELPSTYFIIPFGDQAGQTKSGRAPAHRASGYSLQKIREQIERLCDGIHEIGVHGIDAWAGRVAAESEREAIASATGAPASGVRMHWLYFDESSPLTLQQAGFAYDSTSGYNQTVGYKAGTSQVFRPIGCDELLELPLHIMDTALFYPAYLNLSPSGARARISSIIDNAVRFGGVVTLNWHDRSTAPERLWGETYAVVIEELKAKGAWFATASQAVNWFRSRRMALAHDGIGTSSELHASN